MTVTIIRPTGEELTLNSPRRAWEPKVSVTEHPIENRETVSDHVQIEQNTVTITGMVSETPLGEPDPERVQEALRFLNEAGLGGELLEIESRYDTSGDWILAEWPYDETHLRGLTFQLRCRQIRIADVELVTLPRSVPRVEVQDTAPPGVDVGNQPKQDVDESKEDEVGQTILFSLQQRGLRFLGQ